MLIGLTGYARTGKDTVGQILVEDHGFVRLSFADVIRAFLYAQNPWVRVGDGSYPLVDVVAQLGWEEAKKSNPDIRALLQRTGSEAGRGVLGDEVWIEAALRGIKYDGHYVVTDVRFPNEAQAICDYGGIVIRVDRPGVGPLNDHATETALDEIEVDVYLANSGTIEELKPYIQIIVRESRNG